MARLIRAAAPELTTRPSCPFCGRPGDCPACRQAANALEQALWQAWAIRTLEPVESEEFEVVS